MKKYEVYINGTLAKRCLTFRGAEKLMEKFPAAEGQIYKVIPTIQAVLLKEQNIKN